MLKNIKKIAVVDLNKLINISILVMFLGFIVNGCILQISKCISNEFCQIVDFLLLFIEGIIILITMFRILLKHPKRTITIYGIAVLVFLINYLVFPSNRNAILMMIKKFFLYNLTVFILFLETNKDKSEFKKIVKITRIVFVFSILYLIILLKTNQPIYDLWLARHFFFTIIFALYDFYKYKSTLSAIMNVICFIMLLITGCRTYLITYIICAMLVLGKKLVNYINKTTKKKKIIIYTLIFIVIVLGINYKAISNELYNFFYERNIHIRILRLISTDNFFLSNPRSEIIYPTVIDIIKNNWVIGIGMCGDRVAIYNKFAELQQIPDGYTVNAYYSHNFILEVCSNFGIILSIAFMAIIVYRYYKKIKEDKKSIPLIVCLTCISILPLMLNDTIWNNIYLWALLGVLFSNTKNNEGEDSKENNNVIMLLDNAFDPDVRVYKEAKYLVDNGINVKILCMDKKNKYKDKEDDNYNGIKIKRFYPRTYSTTKIIEKFKIVSKFKDIIYFWWLLKFIYQIKKYLNNESFEILHCHDLIMTFIACLFFSDKKIVFDMHEYYSNKKSKLQNFFIDKIVKYTQNKSTWIIHVNNFQVSKMQDKNKDKLVFIPNYPEKNKFENISHTHSENIRISYTGYVRHYIPLHNLMKAANEIEGIKVYINGSGEEYAALKKEENKLKNSILTGPYNHNDIAKFYENSDIVYVVYNQENKNDETAFPTKFYEAMITGTPVIVSKGTVMSEFVEKNNIGFVVDGTDYLDIKDTLIKILNNKEILKEKSKNVNNISGQYVWENIVQNLDKIYNI